MRRFHRADKGIGRDVEGSCRKWESLQSATTPRLAVEQLDPSLEHQQCQFARLRRIIHLVSILLNYSTVLLSHKTEGW